MKKILTIVAVALLASATVFAVTFSGSVTAGIAVNHNDNWSVQYYGDDGAGTEAGTLKLGVADENGLWSVNFNTIGNFDSSGKWGADLTIGFSEALNAAFGVTLPVDIELSTTYNDRYTVLRAYNNASGNNIDRIRTVGDTTHFAAKVAYQDYVTVAGSWNGNIGPVNSFSVSALTAPIEGLKVSAGYVYGGENKAADWQAYEKATLIGIDKDKDGKDDIETVPNVNELNAAVDVNLGTMLGLGFDLGVSVADRYQFKAEFVNGKYALNTIAATVYGGVDLVSGYVEYAYHKAEKAAQYFEAGVGVALDVVDINAWFGSDNLESFEKTYYVGASVGSSFGGVNYSLAVEYGAENVTDAYNEFGMPGITITPSVSVSF